jgi:2-dehydro-3-deoxyphosphooctonate aldolase (KDO 8-P synthase)
VEQYVTARPVTVGPVTVGGGGPLVLIAGPCVLEGQAMALRVARLIKCIASEYRIPAIFKASFDKANRQSLSSYRGPGLAEGLSLLADVKAATGLPIVTDVHEVSQVEPAAEVADLLQIPAFLCRQTDLVTAAARTNRPVLIKKGQFMAPEDMAAILDKATGAGAGGVLLGERGTAFGYHRLLVDMRGLALMRGFGWPVVFDATHSVQLPGASGGQSGGEREFVPALSRAAAAVGIDALFVEVHLDPAHAKSDAATQLPVQALPAVLTGVLAVDAARRAVMEGRPG